MLLVSPRAVCGQTHSFLGRREPSFFPPSVLVGRLAHFFQPILFLRRESEHLGTGGLISTPSFDQGHHLGRSKIREKHGIRDEFYLFKIFSNAKQTDEYKRFPSASLTPIFSKRNSCRKRNIRNQIHDPPPPRSGSSKGAAVGRTRRTMMRRMKAERYPSRHPGGDPHPSPFGWINRGGSPTPSQLFCSQDGFRFLDRSRFWCCDALNV